MTAMLYILIVSAVAVILAFFVDWGHKDELALNSNIIGFGKAKGLYIIKMENYYVVAGIKVKSKRKAVREFMKLVEENGLLPPGMYFKTFKQEPIIKPAGTVRIIEKQGIKPVPCRESRSIKMNEPVRQVNPAEACPRQTSEEINKTPFRAPRKPDNGIKPKRR